MSLELRCEGAINGLSEEQRTALLERSLARDSEVSTTAAGIIEKVRQGGDRALFEFAREYDGAELTTLEVPRSEWKAAAADLDGDVRTSLERAARNIRRFHEALVPAPVRMEVEPGVVLERRVAPLGRAGVYAPGGRASYPSSVLMGVIPARAVGVEEVVVCCPPGQDGQVAAVVRAACWISNADRLFAVGGAGAVAALAYGTESVPQVDVVVGPGNAYVNEAKRQVAGTVRIDSPAGPSELLIMADHTAPPAWVAAELIAQAEHDVDACVGAVCLTESVLTDIRRALADELTRTPRSDTARAALARHGFLLVASDEAEAVDFATRYAPEHLSIMVENASEIAEKTCTAGTIFVGPSSSVAFGDYLSGANHVLPTAGAARAFSGLSAEHFLRSYTVQTITEEGARALAGPTASLAEAEGLPGHAAAARLRDSIPSASGSTL